VSPSAIRRRRSRMGDATPWPGRRRRGGSGWAVAGCRRASMVASNWSSGIMTERTARRPALRLPRSASHGGVGVRQDG
jgi:hypothetical protein